MLVEVKPYGKLLFSVADCWLAWRDRAFAEGIKTLNQQAPTIAIAVTPPKWLRGIKE